MPSAPSAVARVGCGHRQHPARVHQIDRTADAAEPAQRPLHCRHRRFEIGIEVDGEEKCLNALRPRRQRNRHLRDDRETGLREETVEIGPDTPFIGAIGLFAAEFAQRRAIDAAVRQYRFECGHSGEMIGVRGDAVAPLEGVADKTAMRPGAGHRHQKRQIILIEVIAELLLGNAGLDRDDAQIGIDLDNPAEPGEVDDNTSVARRIGGAVTPIVAGTDRIERDRAVAGNFDDGADVIERSGSQRRGDHALDAGGAHAIALLRRCRIEHSRLADATTPCPHRQRQAFGIHGARSTLGYRAGFGHAFRVNRIGVAEPGSGYRRRSMLTR